ncbi:hypothetical protein BGZ65_005801 [Modicella reniformis]|uniref:Glutathione S-transferase n=1 Tax=Modicella reniformis TaxID=1440133 RepID=A0A9P6SSY1_9FUNG|nr:hypothetical protein BGZ65_005801 [Modicella reniformis]
MVQINSAHFVRDVPTSDLIDIMANPDSFRLYYFAIQGLGQTSRDILSYGDAKWENFEVNEHWNEQKSETPFGCVPVLHVIKGEKMVALSEAATVEQYLAKHYGLLGENQYEETLIKTIHSSSLSTFSEFYASVTWNMPEVHDKCLQGFKGRTLVNWVKTHERHLIDNGSNGHYFGDKLTLADIKTANVIDHFALQPEGPELIEIIKTSPVLWKVKETVDNHPKMSKYRNSNEYKTMVEATRTFYVDCRAAIGI